MKVSTVKSQSMMLRDLLDAKINGTLDDPNDLIVYHPDHTSTPKANITVPVLYVDGLLSSQFARDRKGYHSIQNATIGEFFNLLRVMGHWANTEVTGYGQISDKESVVTINWAVSSLNFLQMKDSGYKVDLDTWFKY